MCALIVGSIFTSGGCTRGVTGTAPTVETAVLNQTTVTVRASLHAGERVRLHGSPITPIKDGKAREIVPGSTETISMPRPRSWGIGPTAPNEDLVFWLRCEVITPTWGTDRVRWYEMLGPPARKVTLSGTPSTKGTDLLATGAIVPLEEVDPSMHPFRDRNRAFRVAGTETPEGE
ncbi:MAG: hypothetical protein DHS20C14_03630 [Phycisphaeraceae bacterium]|nr:MAG: hypothetical protein DHS20C14_03630 [Phycisphaeraceae bacterium]